MYDVLLVDDEPLAIEGLQLLIDWEKRGFRVGAVCTNGEEALRVIRHSPPALVVTDIRMPYMDGLELILRTREAGNDATKFVILSGFDDYVYAREALRLGVTHYMTKPIIGLEADQVLAELQEELGKQLQAGMIRTFAGRYAVKRALTALLSGHAPESERNPELPKLSGFAAGWTYMHIAGEEAALETASETAEQFAEQQRLCWTVDSGDGSLGLVCGSAGTDESEIGQLVQGLYDRLQGEITDSMIGIAVGSTQSSLFAIARSRYEAREAARSLSFNRYPRVVYYDEIKDLPLGFDLRVLEEADSIAEMVEGGDPEALASSIRTIFEIFEHQRMMPELVEVFAVRVIDRCREIYLELGGNEDEFPAASIWDAHLAQSTPYNEAGQRLTALCRKCRQGIAALRERRTGGTIVRVAEYLREHYRESCTIKELAERFYLNPVYLGQSFSAKYGVGIIDYVHDIRIEEAMRLLRETDQTSAAVAEAMGYGSYQHFLKQFEKRTAVKPTEYKQAHNAALQ
ncbi:response regulator [Paenibacillus sp. sptzw28]|uniref:response regulator n=1 Tax=Paenibacillus sp. sptzw28 TaxID=715179 RepID=UPI001C6EFC80|nr:response regulator [Paenibacillus sp. sptzw28]QYR20201.1 response regulator [Paenibacillus sp. sptzw28]